MNDRAELADAVVGSDTVPSPAACYVVATGMFGAAAIVAKDGVRFARWRSALRWGVVAGLTARGLLGGTTATSVLGFPKPSERFRTLDSSFYRPLCLSLAALIGLAQATRNRT